MAAVELSIRKYFVHHLCLHIGANIALPFDLYPPIIDSLGFFCRAWRLGRVSCGKSPCFPSVFSLKDWDSVHSSLDRCRNYVEGNLCTACHMGYSSHLAGQRRLRRISVRPIVRFCDLLLIEIGLRHSHVPPFPIYHRSLWISFSWCCWRKC